MTTGRADSNLKYESESISEFYRDHRTTWDEFYPSERAILDGLGLNLSSTILDLGCGCGGLGIALNDRFGVTEYVGVEINRAAAREANAAVGKFGGVALEGDVATLDASVLPAGPTFDVVVSLSCIDWNVRFDDMFAKAWTLVTEGGWLVVTLRLHPTAQATDMSSAYQFINFEGELVGETAPYIFLRSTTVARMLADLEPVEVRAHGYWGTPSPTAVLPVDRLCFAAFAVRKSPEGDPQQSIVHLDLPSEVVKALLV